MLDLGYPLLEVGGDAYQMGYRHGAEAGDMIRRMLVFICRGVTHAPVGHERVAHERVAHSQLAHRAMRLLPVVAQVSPAFVEEVRGLADGARISFEEAWLIQCRSEARDLPGDPGDEGCTAFAFAGEATSSGHPLAGQNQDLSPEHADLALLLKVQPNDGRPAAIMWTFAGQLGYSGMNETGLALFHNALYDYVTGIGLPRQVTKRLLLEQCSVPACLDWLARIHQQHGFASAANYMLCDVSGAMADVELAHLTVGPTVAEGIAICPSGGQQTFQVHTNHAITAALSRYTKNAPADSARRLQRFTQLAQGAWGVIDVEKLHEFLADHDGDPAGICRHGASGWHSIAGYVAEPHLLRFHVRRGHGCTGAWRTYQL